MATANHLRTNIRTSASARPSSGVTPGSGVAAGLAADILLADSAFDWWLLISAELDNGEVLNIGLDDLDGRTNALGQTITPTHLQFCQIVCSAAAAATLDMTFTEVAAGGSLFGIDATGTIDVGGANLPGIVLGFSATGKAIAATDSLALEVATGTAVDVQVILAGKGTLS